MTQTHKVEIANRLMKLQVNKVLGGKAYRSSQKINVGSADKHTGNLKLNPDQCWKIKKIDCNNFILDAKRDKDHWDLKTGKFCQWDWNG